MKRWLVPAGSSEALAAALQEVLQTSTDVLTDMGSRGKKTVQALHRADFEAATCTTVYERRSKTMTQTSAIPKQAMVSVVLVNWNRATDILDNIRWLKNQTWSHLEIIVVDNGSRDDSLTQLRKIDGIRPTEPGRNGLPTHAMKASVVPPVSSSWPLDSDSYLAVRDLPSWSLECRAIRHWEFLVAE
ncbi:MAG: glycosyltransferase [Planctomycetaceae bacterium]